MQQSTVKTCFTSPSSEGCRWKNQTKPWAVGRLLQWQKQSFRPPEACDFHCASGQNGVRLLKTLVGVCLVKRRHENEKDPLPVAHAAEGSKLRWRAWERLACKSLRKTFSVQLKIVTLEQEEAKMPTFREWLCSPQRFCKAGVWGSCSQLSCNPWINPIQPLVRGSKK